MLAVERLHLNDPSSTDRDAEGYDGSAAHGDHQKQIAVRRQRGERNGADDAAGVCPLLGASNEREQLA